MVHFRTITKGLKMYKVIVSLSSGSHYECGSLEEANKVFDSAPVAETGDRILTANGEIIRREFLEA